MTSCGFTWAAYLEALILGAPAYLWGAYLGGEAIQGLTPPAHVQNHGR